MIWKLLSYPVLIVVIILTTTLLDVLAVPLIAALRKHKTVARAALALKDVVAPIAAVFLAVTIAVNTRLQIPLAIVLAAFLLHARNGLQRLRLAALGASRPALAAAAAGQPYDVASEVRNEWTALFAVNLGFGLAAVMWWSFFEGFF